MVAGAQRRRKLLLQDLFDRATHAVTQLGLHLAKIVGSHASMAYVLSAARPWNKAAPAKI